MSWQKRLFVPQKRVNTLKKETYLFCSVQTPRLVSLVLLRTPYKIHQTLDDEGLFLGRSILLSQPYKTRIDHLFPTHKSSLLSFISFRSQFLRTNPDKSFYPSRTESQMLIFHGQFHHHSLDWFGANKEKESKHWRSIFRGHNYPMIKEHSGFFTLIPSYCSSG